MSQRLSFSRPRGALALALGHFEVTGSGWACAAWDNQDVPKKPKLDFAQNAFRVVQEATHQAEPDANTIAEVLTPKAAAGRLGGLKGGPARRDSMTAEERSDSAKLAARIRWKKPRVSSPSSKKR
jgi:hypothetical protein